MGNDFINEWIIDGDESVNGIVDDLPEAHVLLLLKTGELLYKGMNHTMDSLTLFNAISVIFHIK